MAALATIGAYGFTAETFLDALDVAGVTLLVDVRQRRGVRGREYAWANAKRLQAALDAAGIGYLHVPELAPTTELRELQYAEDANEGASQRTRTELSDAFRDRYVRDVLDPADLEALAARLPADGAAALFCVEREPTACHRSLVAERLRQRYGPSVRHLQPPA